jgi:hypothetical protein
MDGSLAVYLTVETSNFSVIILHSKPSIGRLGPTHNLVVALYMTESLQIRRTIKTKAFCYGTELHPSVYSPVTIYIQYGPNKQNL